MDEPLNSTLFKITQEEFRTGSHNIAELVRGYRTEYRHVSFRNTDDSRHFQRVQLHISAGAGTAGDNLRLWDIPQRYQYCLQPRSDDRQMQQRSHFVFGALMGEQ